MEQIQIGTETEQANGWHYEVSIIDGDRKYSYEATLSFQDYDLWSHGQIAPSAVVEKAFRFLLEREPAGSIMSKFDCSLIRRYFPEVDKELAAHG